MTQTKQNRTDRQDRTLVVPELATSAPVAAKNVMLPTLHSSYKLLLLVNFRTMHK